MDLTSPETIAYIKKKYGFHMTKGLGQNFLCDPTVLREIVTAAQLDEECGALEIGPGIGVLTAALASCAKRVTAIELDSRLLEVLEETLSEYTNVHIVHGDVLKLDLSQLMREEFIGCKRVSIAANLPYYITTPILTRLLEARGFGAESIVVMVQKEVGVRLCAGPGTKHYSSLSVLTAYHSEAEIICSVPASSFLPSPKVESSVVRLRLRATPAVSPTNESVFFKTVRAAFGQRRKTLLNALAGANSIGLGKEELRTVIQGQGLSELVRGEQLGIHEFAALSDAIAKAQR